MSKPTPASWAPPRDPGGSPIDHPRAAEYLKYCATRRFPVAFWEWLENKEKRGDRERSAAQNIMDSEPFCNNPLKLGHSKRRGAVSPR